MAYRVLDENGELLDAHVDVEGAEFVFHSRGGKRGEPSARNLDYGVALRLLLKRIAEAGRLIEGAWVDSDEVRHLDRRSRSILDGADLRAEPRQQFRVLSSRMQVFGRAPDAPYGGSRVKKIRLCVAGVASAEELFSLLGLDDGRSGEAFNRALASIEPDHLWEAMNRAASEPSSASQSDGEFELVADDGCRIRPETVVGLAARMASGTEVPTEDLSSDVAIRYRRLLERAGFDVVPKGASPALVAIPLSSEDREWAEGRPVLVAHLRRERAPGLARAKKQSVLRQHGRLRCERCGLDPVETFGLSSAAACIEVHHSRLEIGRMGEGARTTLADVQLLCANCHRIVHAMMREESSLRL